MPQIPLYVLYTSGTTVSLKVWCAIMAAMQWLWLGRCNIYDIQAGDVFWAASDVGWVVGHSYIVYGPLLWALQP